jgi:hypothetical protein
MDCELVFLLDIDLTGYQRIEGASADIESKLDIPTLLDSRLKRRYGR